MGSTGELEYLSIQLFFGVTGMLILTVFLIAFFVVYQKRLLKQQRRNDMMKIAYQKKLLNIEIIAQEEERKRYAVDLHDGVGGVLSVIKLYVQRMEPALPAEEFQMLQGRALHAIAETMQEVRTVTNDLLPQSLERVGLVAACRALSKKLAETKAIEIDFLCKEERRFDENREKAVFRILQELTNNTLKHSEATQLKLHFDFKPNELHIVFRENGQGFTPGATVTQKSTGMGLKGIEGRVAFLDAQWLYNTAPQEGVSAELTLKLMEPTATP